MLCVTWPAHRFSSSRDWYSALLGSCFGAMTYFSASITVSSGDAKDQQREVVRSLYVATRNQAKALIATLELEGLE